MLELLLGYNLKFLRRAVAFAFAVRAKSPKAIRSLNLSTFKSKELTNTKPVEAIMCTSVACCLVDNAPSLCVRASMCACVCECVYKLYTQIQVELGAHTDNDSGSDASR